MMRDFIRVTAAVLLFLLIIPFNAQTDDPDEFLPLNFYEIRALSEDEQWTFILRTLATDYEVRRGTAGGGFTHQRSLLAQMAHGEPYIDDFVRHLLVYIAVDGLNRDADEGLMDPVELALTDAINQTTDEATRLTLHDLGNSHTGLKHFRHELLPGFTLEIDRQVRLALQNGDDVRPVLDAIREEHTRFLLEIINATPEVIVANGEMSEIAATGTTQVAEVLSPIFREVVIFHVMHRYDMSYASTLPLLQDEFETDPAYTFFSALGVDGTTLLAAGIETMNEAERDAYFSALYTETLAQYMNQTRFLSTFFRLNGLDQATTEGFLANVDALENAVITLLKD